MLVIYRLFFEYFSPTLLASYNIKLFQSSLYFKTNQTMHRAQEDFITPLAYKKIH